MSRLHRDNVADFERGGLLAVALDLHRRKLPLTLCRGKKPIGDQWHRRKWTTAEIKRAFRDNPQLNVGLVLGPRSNLVDLESDSPEAEADFAKLFEQCEIVTPCFQSRRGKHRFCLYDERLAALGNAVIHYGALEIRIGANGKGAQSLLPPSATEGFSRRWLVSLDECPPPPLPEPVFQRLLDVKRNNSSPSKHKQSVRAATLSNTAQRAEDEQEQRQRQVDTLHAPAAATVSAVYQPAIEQAIQETLPNAPRTRNRRIFDFVRRLKAIPSCAAAGVKELKPLIVEWHRRALPHIATKDFAETWFDFANAWNKAKFPEGSEPIVGILEAVMARSLPLVAMNYDDPKLRLLVGLCCQLQSVAGDKPFYLDCRTAGRMLEVSHIQAARWLKVLCLDDVLELVTPGSRRRASEYRFVVNEHG